MLVSSEFQDLKTYIHTRWNIQIINQIVSDIVWFSNKLNGYKADHKNHIHDKKKLKMYESEKQRKITWYNRVMNGKIKRPGTASERHLIIVLM